MPSETAAYLGPTASFSHQAALAYSSSSSSSTTLVPHPSFSSVFSAVQSSSASYALIPFENSTNGSVIQTLDLLCDREGLYPDVRVCDEHYFTVHHCLLVKPSASRKPKGEGGGHHQGLSFEAQLQGIKKLYTHPQVWGQCERFLGKHLGKERGVENMDMSSTSRAAELIAANNKDDEDEDDGHSNAAAAIASALAAKVYGLDILASNIEDRADNTTRFFVLRNQKSTSNSMPGSSSSNRSTNPPPPPPTTSLPLPSPTNSTPTPKTYKSLLLFTIDHSRPGALATALAVFQRHNLNLTSIHTRPSRQQQPQPQPQQQRQERQQQQQQQQQWHYIFFVECRGECGEEDDGDGDGDRSGNGNGNVKEAIKALGEVTQGCRCLGTWREGKRGG